MANFIMIQSNTLKMCVVKIIATVCFIINPCVILILFLQMPQLILQWRTEKCLVNNMVIVVHHYIWTTINSFHTFVYCLYVKIFSSLLLNIYASVKLKWDLFSVLSFYIPLICIECKLFITETRKKRYG